MPIQKGTALGQLRDSSGDVDRQGGGFSCATAARAGRSLKAISATFLNGGLITGEIFRQERHQAMPKLLQARTSRDANEERAVRKLAASPHVPGDWIARAKMIVLSWDGWRTSSIATELQCHPQMVRERITRFNNEGLA